MDRKMISLVDDDSSIVESLQIILEGEGYAVVSATNGADLKKDIKKNIPNLFILDYRLPRENGAQLTRFLKRNAPTRQVPIMIISANQKIEAITQEAGADDFLEKPFDIDVFLKKVKKLTL